MLSKVQTRRLEVWIHRKHCAGVQMTLILVENKVEKCILFSLHPALTE